MTKEYEELYVKTSDGVKIALNHYKRNHQKALIIAPGWTMSKDSKFIDEIAKEFAKTFDVISFEFRGHGKSSGVYTFTKDEPKDLSAVVDYTKKMYKETCLIGFSLGGAISIIYSAFNDCLDGLVIVSAPICFKEIKHYMWVKDFLINPFKKYELKRWITLRANPFAEKNISPIDVVDKISIPTLFIAGDSDTITLSKDTKGLFHKAKCLKKFELFQNCNHAEDLVYQKKDRLVNTCIEWFLSDKSIFTKNK